MLTQRQIELLLVVVAEELNRSTPLGNNLVNGAGATSDDLKELANAFYTLQKMSNPKS